jgi:hypothetical protein
LLDCGASSENRGRCRRLGLLPTHLRLTSARLAVRDTLARMPPVLWLNRMALFSGCRRRRIHPLASSTGVIAISRAPRRVRSHHGLAEAIGSSRFGERAMHYRPGF